MNDEKMIYSLNIKDIQTVANEKLIVTLTIVNLNLLKTNWVTILIGLEQYPTLSVM